MDPREGTAVATRRPDSGWTILEILLVLGVVSLLLSIALPNFHASRIRNDEAAAVRTLREIGSAQEIFRGAERGVDLDGDGRGEYALLQELSGTTLPRGRAAGPPAILPQLRLNLRPDGDADLCGYRIRLLLPGPGGEALREGAGGPAAPDPRLAAQFWCAYAWPHRREGFLPAATGERTFFANQVGTVLAAEGAYHALPAEEGGPVKEPEPGAAFSGSGPSGTITGAPAVGTTGRDGSLWLPIR